MTFLIKDGTGSGYTAKVDALHRLHTHSFIVSMEQSSVLRGDAYTISSEVVSLTSDSKSAIFYIKNTGDDDLLMFQQFLNVGTSTGGVGNEVTITYNLGATAGDIITDEVVASPSNRRLLDSGVLSAITYKGSEGKTASGGTENAFLTTGFVNDAPTAIPPGIAMSVSITPSSGTTAQSVTFGMSVIEDASTYGND